MADELERMKAALAAAEGRAEQERAERLAAEGRAEQERAERLAAEGRAEQERAERLAAEGRAKAAEGRTEQERAERLAAEAEKAAAEKITYTTAEEALREGPGVFQKQMKTEKSETELKGRYARPARIQKWQGFGEYSERLLQKIGSRRVRRQEFENDDYPDYEHNVSLLATITLKQTTATLHQAGRLRGFKPFYGAKADERGGGIPDKIVTHDDKAMYIVEFKRPSVIFDSNEDAELSPYTLNLHYDGSDLGKKNLLATTLQTYSYLISKGNLVYGFFTNYTYWVFIRRVHDKEGTEVLELSDFIPREDARLAIATFLCKMYQHSVRAADGAAAAGNGGAAAQGGGEEDEDQEDGDDGTGPQPRLASVVLPPGQGLEKGVEEGLDREDCFFSTLTTVAGQQFTTTQRYLGVNDLSVTELLHSTVLSSNEKATTFRYRNGGHDLVWRQLDVYGLPRQCKDYSLEVLQQMIMNEIKAYVHLQQCWGRLVPHFKYFGVDWASLWVFVTSYEGTSLDQLATERGGLTQRVKDKAVQSLKELHTFGVLHGDAHPRNVLLRKEDDMTLWIDFELAAIEPEDHLSLARIEVETFVEKLSGIPTLPAAEEALPSHLPNPAPAPETVSKAPITSRKRGKISACCCVHPML